MEHWYREYGGPYRFRLGRRQFIVVAERETLRELLQRRPSAFRRSEHLSEIIDELGGGGVFSAEGESWKRQRKLTVPGFNQSRLRSFFPQLLRIAERAHRVWDAAADRPGVWELEVDFERFTTDVMTYIAFGHDVNSIEGKTDTLRLDMQRIFPALNYRMQAPIAHWRYLRLAGDRELERAVQRLRENIQRVIADTRACLAADPARVHAPETMLESMIAAELLDPEREGLDDEELFGNVLTLLMAGHDTTAHTLAWVTHALVSIEGVQARVRAELDRVLGDSPGLRTIDDVDKLPYLNGVLHEVLRLRSVAPIMFLSALEPTSVGGIAVDPADVVVALTRLCAISDENFSRPQEFLPERWLASETPSKGCPVHNPKAFLPFGAGPRICPGRGLSLLEMHCVIARLCRNFELVSVAGARPVEEHMAFTMSPVGIEIRLRRRPSSSAPLVS